MNRIVYLFFIGITLSSLTALSATAANNRECNMRHIWQQAPIVLDEKVLHECLASNEYSHEDKVEFMRYLSTWGTNPLVMRVLVLEGKMGVNMRDFHGKTLMHVAAHNCNHAMLRELHSLGADINAGIESSQSNGGETPLFHACVAPSGIFPPQYPEDAYIKTLETLFELGADPKAKNKHGYSAVDVAIQPTWEALEIMVKHGVEDKNGRAKKSVSVLVGDVVGYGMNFLGQIRDRLF